MPHYKNGDEAKVGDRVIFTTQEYSSAISGYVETRREGLVIAIFPGSETCNATVGYPHMDIHNQGTSQEVRLPRIATHTVTLGQCEKCT